MTDNNQWIVLILLVVIAMILLKKGKPTWNRTKTIMAIIMGVLTILQIIYVHQIARFLFDR